MDPCGLAGAAGPAPERLLSAARAPTCRGPCGDRGAGGAGHEVPAGRGHGIPGSDRIVACAHDDVVTGRQAGPHEVRQGRGGVFRDGPARVS